MFNRSPIKLIPVSYPRHKVPLGKPFVYRIEKKHANTEIRHYLKHQNLFYPKPLSDWTTAGQIDLYLEAPGKYVLCVEWRQPDGAHGWVEEPFAVYGPVNNTPHKVALDKHTSIWAPSKWEANLLASYEPVTFGELSHLVKPGWVAYDVGANFGQYSLCLSRLVGKKGRVYAIEANPVCIYFLCANLETNKRDNVEILPLALLHDDQTTEFTINYGNQALGISTDLHLFAGKAGHAITVSGLGFDQLVERYNLQKPDFVKIDIEGAEGKALTGMHRTLREHRPVLLIEVHGRLAAEETFAELAAYDYRYHHPHSQAQYATSDELLAWFPDTVTQIFCHPR